MTSGGVHFDTALAKRQSTDSSIASTASLTGYFNTPRLLPAYVGLQADDVAFDVDKIDGTTAPTLGQVVLIPVNIVQDRSIDAIKFGIAATTMTNCYVGLYATDLTSGDISKVIDLGDCKSQLDTAFNVQNIDLPTVPGVQRGELYYIAVLQVGGTAAAMHRFSSATNFSTGLYPRFRGNVYATGSQTSLPSTITSANIVSGTRFWGALGTAATPVTPGAVYLSDDFGRSTLGPSWTIRNGGINIVNSTAVGSNIFAANIATHNTRLTSLNQKVGYHAYTTSGTNTIFLRANGTGPRAELSIASGNVKIQTHTAAYSTSTPTSRQSLTGQNTLGSWTFDAVGNTYTGYLNGVVKIQWVDSGGAFTVASNATEVGFQAGTSSNTGDDMDDWFAQDL